MILEIQDLLLGCPVDLASAEGGDHIIEEEHVWEELHPQVGVKKRLRAPRSTSKNTP